MSGFAIPPLSSGINFDMSQFTGGMDRVQATAAAFPAMIAQNIDATMKHSEATMGQSVQEIGAHLDTLKGKSEIHGHASMDASGIEHGMLSAEATMKLFPAIIVETIENPMLGAVAAAKEGLQGSAEAAKAAFEKIADVTKEVAKHFQDINLGSIKTGLSPEVFSTYGAAAKACGVEVQTLTGGLEMLADKAANALRGDVGAIKGFTELGIKVSELKKLLADPQALIDRIAGSIEKMGSNAQQLQAMRDTMGKMGADLLPFFQRGPEALHEMAEGFGKLGAKVDEEEAELGNMWAQTSEAFSAMWEGIQTALAKPILQYFAAHINEIMPRLTGLAESVGKAVEKMMEYLPGALETAGSLLAGLADLATTTLAPAFKIVLKIVEALALEIKIMADAAAVGLNDVAGLLHHIGGDEAGAQNAYKRGNEAVARLRDDFGPDPFHIHVHNTINTREGETADKAAEQTKETVKVEIQKHVAKQKVARAFGGRR